jgi:predicted NBD/HSP70 family sugar kinase
VTTFRIGVDLGGTKIEAALLDASGTVQARRRAPTPAGDYPEILATISDLVAELEAEAGGRATVGVATPGALSPATGLLRNSNSVALNCRPIDRDLARMLGRPVRIANDADCFALSEAVDGAARGAEVVFGVILGTGTGGGVVVRGALVRGPNAIAGEWGHNALPWPEDAERPGPPCYCGKTGCIETFLSGPGLARDHRESTGEALTAAEIARRADAGDVACEATLRRYEDRLARGLAMVMNVLDPHVIVLGGGLSQMQRLYAYVPKIWGRYVFSERVDTRLVPPLHGDSSGVRGAAWLWPE